jgi:hypothetical protein
MYIYVFKDLMRIYLVMYKSLSYVHPLIFVLLYIYVFSCLYLVYVILYSFADELLDLRPINNYNLLCLSSESPLLVMIWVRICPQHPHACRKRRLNGAGLWIRQEKPRPPLTVGVTLERPIPAQRPCVPSIGLFFFCSPSPAMVTSPYKWMFLSETYKTVNNQSIGDLILNRFDVCIRTIIGVPSYTGLDLNADV